MNAQFLSATNQDGQPNGADKNFVERVRINQQKLGSELKSNYDFIVCGSGSSGSVVARWPTPCCASPTDNSRTVVWPSALITSLLVGTIGIPR